MRIISGTLGGRVIHPPAKMPYTRPTTDIAKEGLFNILQNNLNIEILKIRQPGKALRTVLRAEHCNRFLTAEAYHRWIANSWINNWIILDCRHSRPQKYRMIASFLPLGPHS